MVQVVDELDLFHFGVRLAQLGRYEDAVRLLERFSHRFPGREVFNNLGFCYYELARQAPVFQSHADSLRFDLPAVLAELLAPEIAAGVVGAAAATPTA